jgi:glycolate oxidase iron-sulfur subunit
VREGDEPGVCCGAGGAYSVLQPALATDIRDRKADTLRGPDTIVTTNPGCQLHLAGAGLPMEHLATYLARRLGVGRFARK